MAATRVRIELLGGFAVRVDDRSVPDDAWTARRAAELVALLALSDGCRLTRDQVVEALFSHLDGEAGAANLRKAAHHARRALGDPGAIVQRGGGVALFDTAIIEVDARRFEAAAAAALGTGDPERCATAAELYTGDLLPGSPYEDWTQAVRARLRATQVELLRASEQFERLVEVEPTDEPAHRELMRRALDAGRRPEAIRAYGRLRVALRRELGIAPDARTVELYDACVAGLAADTLPLVGRALELARATAVLRGATADTIAVRGPAGIGKTAFCDELATVAAQHGWDVVRAQAHEDDDPYAAFVRLVEELVARDRGLLGAVGVRARSVLAALTPVAGPAPELEVALTRHQVIGACRRLLHAAAGGGRTLLVLDDVHRADEALVDLAGHLGSLAGRPIVLVLAFRAEAAPASLQRAVARLARADRMLALDLEPLETDDATALATAVGSRPPEVMDRVVALGQGNPFLTLELARSAVAGVPALVGRAADAVAGRFLDLEPDVLEALQRLALTGEEVDPLEVAALAGATEEEAIALLDAALRSGTLVVHDGRYRFRHELVRRLLVERLAPHARQQAHREAAVRLRDAGGAPRRIARQWLEGGRPADAGPWCLAAARAAVGLSAFGDVLVHLAPLLEHDPQHAEALRLRAQSLDALGEPHAPAAYAEAAAVAADGADDLRAMQALATVKRGDPPAALELLQGLQPETLEGQVAEALAFSGAAALGFGDPSIGTAKAAQARRLAVRTGDQASVAIASWAQAAAAHASGELRANVLANLEDTSALPRLAVTVFDGQLCMTQRLLYGARPYADVVAFATGLEQESARLGAARGRAFAVTIRGEAWLLAGRLDEAEADLRAGVDLHARQDAATGVSFSLQRLAEVALHRGDRAEAAALLDESLAVARESDVGFHLLDRIYGTRVQVASEPDAGLAALEEAEAAVRGPIETCPGCRITLAVPASIAAVRGHDGARVESWVAEAEYLAGTVMRLPAWHASMDEIAGHRAVAGGTASEARERFLVAAHRFADAGHALDEARCRGLAEHVCT